MRWQFQLALTARARLDPRIVLLWGDVGAGLFRDFAREMPDRCLNVGICEQATVSMAAGLAIAGLRPVVYTITPFLIERAFEQIKLDVGQMNLPVGLVGYSDATAGPTHEELDARALMSLVPNLNRYYPPTTADAGRFTSAIDLDRPWFMALRP